MSFMFHDSNSAKKIKLDPHIAVTSLNLDRISACLSEPAVNIAVIDSYGNTLLHSTLKNKFNDLPTQRQIIQVLEILLDNGMDINVRNRHLETVLHLAIDKRMREVVQMLIKRGADVNVRDSLGNKLVHFFINKVCQRKLIGEEGSAQFLDFLVQQGVDINCENSDGESVIAIAAKNNLVPIITTCLRHNVNVNIEGLNTLFDKILNEFLTSNNKKQKCELDKCLSILLSKGVDVNKKNAEGLTPLQLAFQRKNVNLMLLLEKHRADLSVLKNDNYLHRLCSRRTKGNLNSRTAYKNLTRLLVRAGCHLNALDTEGRTPLYRATEAGNVKMVRVLVELKFDVNDRGPHQLTPLHRAAMDDKVDIVEILIASGADVNVKSACGSTPLHFASLQKNPAIVNSLLNDGARVDVIDNNGAKPLDLAIRNRNSCVVRALLSAGGRVDDYATFREIEKLIGLYVDCTNLREKCIKRVAIGMFAGGGGSRFYSRNQFHRQFYVACSKEVDRLKSWKISDRLSFYDFLHMDWNSRCRKSFVSNEKILELLGVKQKREVMELIDNALIKDVDEIPVDFSKLKAEFPLYHKIIYSTYVKTFLRRPLLEPAERAWYKLTDINLPNVCVLKILAYLPNDTLWVMIEGVKSGNLKRPLITGFEEAAKKQRLSE